MGNPPNPTALFVADSHFHLVPDSPERHRLERFLEFLVFAREADHLVLLGDIFDFWFDYPHFRLKGYDELLQALDRVRESGTRLHFVGGNHDIWAADYFGDRYGTTGRGQAQTLTLGSLRVRVDHGDGMFAHGAAYRTFRALVRLRAGVLAAKVLHPELLYLLSTALSGSSRRATRDEAAVIERRATRRLASLGDAPWDLTVIGHIHYAFQISAGNRTLASLAGWLADEGYGLLQGGTFRLLDFAADPHPVLRPAGPVSSADPA
jgi:UDP-2,3-diacylglucosamine hydrolase